MMRIVFGIFLLLPQVCFGLEDFDLSVIDQYMQQLDKIPESNFDNIDPKLLKSEQDPLYFKGQARNTLKWDEIEEHEWLSIKVWKEERKIKDQDMEWRSKVRLNEYDEVIGKVIKCVGVCFSYRGVKKVTAEYQSLLKEGDEFLTSKDSYAWVFLMDGSLVRVAPESSISLLEINFNKVDNFIMLRLNSGYMNYLPRSTQELEIIERVETDLGFSPLPIKEANREFYMMKSFRGLDEVERFKYTIQKSPGAKEQYEALNQWIRYNNEFLGTRETKVFLFTPNFSIEGARGNIHMFYEPNGVGYFYLDPVKRASTEEQTSENTDLVVGRRGYNNTQSFTPAWETWYQVGAQGKEISALSSKLPLLKGSLGFLKRIPSIQLVREIWIKEKLIPLLKSDMTEKTVAKQYGYRLWNIVDVAEQQKRLNFIREFTRRVETTNLNAIKKIFVGKVLYGFDLKYIRKPLEAHYMQVKKRYTKERSKVYRFTDTEYYLWLLRNAM